MTVDIDELEDGAAPEMTNREKVLQRVVIPFSLLLIVFGLFTTTGAYTGQNLWAGPPVFAAGVIMLSYCLEVPQRSRELYQDLREGSMKKRIQIASGAAGFFTVMIGGYYSYISSARLGLQPAGFPLVHFLTGFCWWLIPSGVLWAVKMAINEYPTRKKSAWAFGYLLSSWMVMVLVSLAGLAFLGYSIEILTAEEMIARARIYIALASLLLVLAGYIYHRRPSEPIS